MNAPGQLGQCSVRSCGFTGRPGDAATAVSALTSAVSLGAVIAARRHQLVPAAIATAVQMALTLVYWEQMVRYFDRRPRAGGTRPQ